MFTVLHYCIVSFLCTCAFISRFISIAKYTFDMHR